MNILRFHKLFLFSHEEWRGLAESRPEALKLFILQVLPFALVPPIMLEYASRHAGAAMLPNVPDQEWGVIALLFMLGEVATVPLMAWAIRSVAAGKGIHSRYYDTFLLAVVAPAPLWLSSLALFFEQFALVVFLGLLGLAGFILLVFRGVKSMLGVSEGLIAFEIAYTVTALGLIAWGALAVLGLLPALP